MAEADIAATPQRSAADAAPARPLSVHAITAAAWVKIAILTSLLFGLFWQYNLVRLWRKTNPWTGEAGWQHSLFVPLIGVYYLYVNRDRLLSARVRASWDGLLIILVGLAVFMYGVYPGQNEWLSDAGVVITIFGVTLLTCGWEVMRVAWFPILFLFCGVPWPGLVYSKVALPLQQFAAGQAVDILRICGVDAESSGTKIFIGGFGSPMRTLNVAEACAGLRSLMTFITLATAIAFLSVRPLWQKLVISASAVPIAILCNVMRIAVQGLLDHFVSEELSEGFAHATVGLIMLLPAIPLILLVCWILDHMFIEEAPAPAPGVAARPRDARLIVRRRAVAAAHADQNGAAAQPTKSA